MRVYLSLAQIIISVVLIVIILLQAKGSGGLGGIFGGGDGGFYRTRRGLEKTLFNLTIVLATLFLLISLVSVLVGG